MTATLAKIQGNQVKAHASCNSVGAATKEVESLSHSQDTYTTRLGPMDVVEFRDERLPERFWNKVRPEINGCWIWTACRVRSGYGQFSYNGKLRAAHRVTAATFIGSIPEHLVCDHLCGHTACVNPAHIEYVTQSVNVRRGIPMDGGTTCRNGHAGTPENRYARPDGRVECRVCKYLAKVEYRRRAALTNSQEEDGA